MANDEDLARIRQGVDVWNDWRTQNRVRRVDRGPPKTILAGKNLIGANVLGANLLSAMLTDAKLPKADLTRVDLTGADLASADLGEVDFASAILTRANLTGADLTGADLGRANLAWANLTGANLGMANLTGANLGWANLRWANLTGANLGMANLGMANLTGADLGRTNLGRAILTGANLPKTNLGGANLGGAILTGANLTSAILIETDLTNADLTGCCVYGISAWDLKLAGAKQRDLVITSVGEPEITVDNIEVGQFIYLILHNEKIRDVIDTIGKKGVLLLGRFTEGRLAVLERLRDELRQRGFLPMVFNFDKPETKDFTETVRLLVGLSRFVIADITNPRSAPLELQATIPEYMIPFVPILEKGEEPFAMFKDLWIKHSVWVLDPMRYPSVDRWRCWTREIVKPAEARFVELLARKSEGFRIKDI